MNEVMGAKFLQTEKHGEHILETHLSLPCKIMGNPRVPVNSARTLVGLGVLFRPLTLETF